MLLRFKPGRRNPEGQPQKIPRKRLAAYAAIVLIAGAGRLTYDEYLIQKFAGRLPPALEREVSFSEEIAPILDNHCRRCHNPQKPRGEYDVTTRAALISGGERGPAVRVGNANRSVLMHLVVAHGEEWKMPPDGERLTNEEIALLRTWIDQGVPFDE